MRLNVVYRDKHRLIEINAPSYKDAFDTLRIYDKTAFDDPAGIRLYDMSDQEERKDYYAETRDWFGGIPEEPTGVINVTGPGSFTYKRNHDGLGRIY